jgi:hypothetical protein
MKHVGQTWFSVAFACELAKASAENGTSNGLDASQLREGISQVVKGLIDKEADIQVVRLTDSRPESYPGYTRLGRPYFGTDFLMDFHGKKNTVDRIVNRSLVVQLYIAMSKMELGTPSVRDSFLSMIVHKMMDLSKSDSDLIPHHLVPFAKLLAAALTHPATQPGSHHTICQLITEIWKSYLREVVQARPTPPSLAMSPIRGISNEINQVNRFLADPTRTRFEFRANKNIRESMESDVRMVHHEAVLCETPRTGSPHVLVITKRPDFPYKRKLQGWNAVASEATQHLRQCPQLIENRILDPSFFTTLPEESMRFVLTPWFQPGAALGYQGQAPQSTNVIPTPIPGNASSAVPAKRKASDEIVDLTGA